LTSLLQFVVLGLGIGATYALFAQGAVLIYRGSGLVNFGQGTIGMMSAYLGFIELKTGRDWPTAPSLIAGVVIAVVISLLFQSLVLRYLKDAAAIVRVISTIGLLALLTAIAIKRWGGSNRPVDQYLPNDVYNWGGVRVEESRLWIVAISILVTIALWAWTKFTRIGLAINASAQNERAVQTLGWSPNRLAALTWGIGGGLAGLAAVLVAPLTGLSTTTFTIVVTVAGLSAALLGGFHSFPMTFVGGLVVGLSEALATRYKGDIEDLFLQDQITGLNRATAFLIILLVLVVRGRGLPLRSHVAERLPKLGSGQINIRGLVLASAIFLALLFFVFDDKWARASFVSLALGVMILSVVVLTGYAGQISLAQWALGGIGALAAGRLIRADVPTELAIVLGILITIPVGLLFALPALRTRGVNLAVVTLGLGFAVSEVVFGNARYLGDPLDAGTRIGRIKLFGISVDAFDHPHAWAFVSFLALFGISLMVSNLRRSRTGRRLIAVRTNERAAASLGISVVSVKLYAFGVSAGIAAVGGILVGFRSSTINYTGFNVFESINTVGFAVIGGLGYVLAGIFAAPNAVGGIGTRIMEDLLRIGDWDLILGGAFVLIILLANQDGVAAVATDHLRPLVRKLGLSKEPPPHDPLPEAEMQTVAPVALTVEDLTVRFGGVVAVDGASFKVGPGEVVGLIGPNGAGKTTIIDAVTGFVTPSAGTISMGEQQIEKFRATKRARLGLRRSFQSLELFEDISVEDNIRAGADQGATKWSWVTDLFWPGKHPLQPTAVAAIKGFELEDHLNQLPTELSYGQRRLVGIARTVASGPSIIMLDEPAAGLDETESKELSTLIRRMADERGMGVLLIEHDVGLVMSTCDRIVVIDFGAVIDRGDPAHIRQSDAVKRAYLGSSDDEEVAV
jgi:ABC-type branched-subunit amino acid transport system ATPase component/branched-subunit amino acid ABC-type transport system permease component